MGRVPLPDAGAGLDGLALSLVRLREFAGAPSYANIAFAVGDLRERESRAGGRPGKVTVYDCFRTGRRRIDAELFNDLVVVLGVPESDRHLWTEAYRVVTGTKILDAVSAPNELRSPGALIGRAREMARLASLPPGRIAMIDGPPGAGKTELALHVSTVWARALGDAAMTFAVNLRGHDPDLPPLSAPELMGRLLRGAGLAGGRVDALDLDARMALLRSTVGDRPAVIVLDNAASAEQLGPLAHPPARWRILVTSRRQLPELSSAHSDVISLGRLDDAAAVELLAGLVGRERVEAEPEAAQRIAGRCAGMALDLSVAGAMVAAQPEWSLDDHAARLESMPVHELSRPALQVSYDRLPEGVQRTLRRIALLPGGEYDLLDAVALTGVGEGATREHLAVLKAEHLLEAVGPQRHCLHDVVRAFALQHATALDPRSAQRSAMLAWGEALVAEVTERTSGARPDPAWIDTRAGVLSAFGSLAQQWEMPEQLVRLALVLAVSVESTAELALTEDVLRSALEVAPADQRRRLGRGLAFTVLLRGRLAQAVVLFDELLAQDPDDPEFELLWKGWIAQHASARAGIGQYVQAIRHARRNGNTEVESRATANIANLLRIRGHHVWSAHLLDRAEQMAGEHGHDQVTSLIGCHRTILLEYCGDFDDAVRVGRETLSRTEHLRPGVHDIYTRAALGRALLMVGDLRAARAEIERARADTERMGLYGLSIQLTVIEGRLMRAEGHVEAARATLRSGIELAEQAGSPVVACEARAWLARFADEDGDADLAARLRAAITERGFTEVALIPEAWGRRLGVA